MSSDEITSLVVKMLIMVLMPLGTKYGLDGNTIVAIASWLGAGAALAYGVYSHRGMKLIPNKATGLVLPTTPPPVGTVVDLAPMTGLAKVVGVILLCMIALPALAQTKRPVLTGNPVNDIENAISQPGSPLAKATTDLAKLLTDIADFSDAVTLSSQIPGLQDPVGAACWTQFTPIQALIKVHPLPLTFKLASDIEAGRLAIIGMNQVCANPNCGQMFLDATNIANSLSANPIPITLSSICSRIAVIGTNAVPTAGSTAIPPVGTTATPAPVPAATPEPVVTPAK